MKCARRVCASLVSFAFSCAFLGGSLHGATPTVLVSDCGTVDVPAEASTSGVVCLGVCAIGYSHQTCVVPDRAASLRTQEPAIQGVDSLVFLAQGDSTTVGSAAAVLRAVTGWRVEIVGDIATLPLKPQRWQVPWSKLSKRTLRTEIGPRVRILVDDSTQTIWLASTR